MNEQRINIVKKILANYDRNPENVLLVLEDIQLEFKYLSEDNLYLVADYFGLPLSRVYSLATFYKSFSLRPKGEHHICVCTGTACHVRGAERIVERVTQELGIKPGETSSDMRFSLETVNCLGACALGPLVVIDGKYHGKVTSAKVDKIIKTYK